MNSPDQRTPVPGTAGVPASPPRRVLVVDDSQDARSILRLLLTKLGHDTRTAADAQSGIAISKDFQPEIVLCDLMMAGGMTGYAFAKAARAEQTLGEVCLVAISGWDGPDYERQAYSAGFDRLMKKPLGLSDLQAILQSPPRRPGTQPAPPAEPCIETGGDVQA